MQIHLLNSDGEVTGPVSLDSPQARDAHPDTPSRGTDNIWLPISQRITATQPAAPESAPPSASNPLVARPAPSTPSPAVPAPLWRQVLGANIMTAALLTIPGLLVTQGASGLLIAILIAALFFVIGYVVATS